MLREPLYHLAQHPLVRGVATHNRLARKMAHRFVAGETLDEALAAVREINRRGMTASLDHLGENVSSRAEAVEAMNAGTEIYRAISASALESNASFKLSQLGLDVSPELAQENIEAIAGQADELGNFVRIDMEGSKYVRRTLEVFYRVHERYRNVGVVIQSMLHRSEPDLERLIERGVRVRLVKGAYLEPPEVAYQRKADVDANFVRLMEMLLDGGNYPALATQDEKMIAATTTRARARGIDPVNFEFQMLYGVRRDLQSRLVCEGYKIRIYVPYGTHWYPYLVRRLAERPANVMFFLGSLAREAAARRR
jgi:proline dehydrogenase